MSISQAELSLDNADFAERVPHELFQRMRDEEPVLWYDWEYGEGFWAVTRYDDIVTVLKDWRTYSSETGGTALEDLERDQIEARKSMLDEDPPEHSSLRAIVNKGFTPRAVAAYEELLRELTTQILDEALPKGEFDFIEEVAKQLPIQVLCRILGVPLEDDERMIDLGDRMIGNTDPDSGGLHPGSRRERRVPAAAVLAARTPRSCSIRPRAGGQRRADPQDDLVSKLVDVGGRRGPAADRAGVRHDVPAAGRGRQRDHPPVDRPRREGADGAPRGDAADARRPRGDEDRASRRSCAGRHR